MKVIMLKDVKGVGQRHTVQEVSDGYALNFLIAQGLAEQATTRKILALEQYKHANTVASAQKDREWATLAEKITNAPLEISARANASGHLYEQVSPALIVEALRTQFSAEIPTSAIVLNAPIKSLGVHEVGVRLGERTTKCILTVSAA